MECSSVSVCLWNLRSLASELHRLQFTIRKTTTCHPLSHSTRPSCLSASLSEPPRPSAIILLPASVLTLPPPSTSQNQSSQGPTRLRRLLDPRDVNLITNIHDDRIS
ncbi:hypothetical protein CDEST_13211 [Colletotrichum destructivum]|uniref:Uncharacterized protein n=1 Tax=Colletotrichum destructivum TaxID=34406 RepID=A0AAX4IYD0_9PEZI|nr:hypothetical protein CDEST_13211 [Colletotrichum destructivum]